MSRYIQLYPLRGKIVKDLDWLKEYPYCGYSVLMAGYPMVIRLFDLRLSEAGRRYYAFVEKGISMGQSKDLTGGKLKYSEDLNFVSNKDKGAESFF